MATLLRDSVFVTVLVDSYGVSSVARTTSIAVDDGLDGEHHSWESSVTEDVDTICKTACCSMSPAGTAVDGNVLISGVTEEVDAIDVAPVPILWELFGTQKLMGKRGFDERSLEGWVSTVAAIPMEQFMPPSLHWCTEGFGRGSLVTFVIGPSVPRNGIGALTFDTEVVLAPNDAEHTQLTPVSTPRVPHNPVVGAVL